MTLIFFWGGGGGEEVRWKTVRTYGKILATPLERFANLAVVSLRWNNEPQRPQIYGNIVFLKRMRLRNELELFVLFITKFQVECRF